MVLITCITISFGLLLSYLRTQQALQWLYRRQSIQLDCEADQIRNGLLQESLAMRRTLELSLEDSKEISHRLGQNLLDKIEEFHDSLDRLVDRLVPPYSEDSLPLAIQYIVESWRERMSQVKIDLDLPVEWRYEPPERCRIVLMALNELLRIISSEYLAEFSIHIRLKIKDNLAELMVKIPGSNGDILMSDSRLQDWEYLSESFQFIASGESLHEYQDSGEVWYFRWGN
ncbi:MAG TPA: hypothetical protein DEG17_12685 [Cyanobacteria bacterium UBA11149]|nr:hypothetical protein [Cyanobacteria bacterium UBA11367]HBE59944.1 hypothetical protein [Cyanobacteria bacterium UBA11366]HBK64673.1 hypothetical protein [Cyanobacteria bacterium UBA11166]HBR74081.1 hypothetical protein [Cyanobacteria bacterium UBA11159]HBS69322.1 hypothetical protein [Cyanobacteria bacterium UBA11153]HBW89702.1 hypothetical protein [Cyanobacteria bacterium UBA11149]HCA93338.1 hypothetical protein [Cyanobacteria bacterium UBA9226]